MVFIHLDIYFNSLCTILHVSESVPFAGLIQNFLVFSTLHLRRDKLSKPLEKELFAGTVKLSVISYIDKKIKATEF